MRYIHTLVFLCSLVASGAVYTVSHSASPSITYIKSESEIISEEEPPDAVTLPVAEEPVAINEDKAVSQSEEHDSDEVETETETPVADSNAFSTGKPFVVPFYSQFYDISAPEWRKIGCGIASLAMLIDFYESNSVSVDELLNEGIAAGAYITSAGWSHAGLIGLAKSYGLTGNTVGLSDLSMTEAFATLQEDLLEGPVIASVHYTFQPTNPIPHLVVVTGVEGGEVHYNDRADSGADGTVSIEQFKSAWKKRYIAIRPEV